MKLFPGSTDAARKIFIELIECADLEIKAAEKVLVMLRDRGYDVNRFIDLYNGLALIYSFTDGELVH